MAHSQRGRARGEAPGEVPGGRWAGERAAVSRILSTNIVYLCNELTRLPLPHEVRTFSSPAARTPRVEAGFSWPPPHPRDQGRGWSSSLRVDSRTRPVSCNSPRREGVQGCASTGSALGRCLQSGLNQRGDALLPKRSTFAPREPPDYFYPQLALHQPARLLGSPRAPVSSFNPYSCALVQVGSQTGTKGKALLIAALRDLGLRTEMRQF